MNKSLHSLSYCLRIYLRIVCVCFFALCWVSQAVALPIKSLTKAEAEAITFSWTDKAGVVHNSNLAEKATNPYHIIALCKEVYTNPAVPGNYYRGYNASFQAVKVLSGEQLNTYYGAIYDVSNKVYKYGGWGITECTKPAEEGYTAMLVAVKDTYVAPSTKHGFTTEADNIDVLANYIETNIESVEVLTDAHRMGSASDHTSGTIFSISGSYSRFFFMLKGKCLQNSSTLGIYPFGKMFEELSPYDLIAGEDATDIYYQLIHGQKLPIQHDCSSVLDQGHVGSLSDTNTRYNLTGLQLFIPDYRMHYWYKYYSSHNPRYEGREQYMKGSTGKSNSDVSMYYVNYDANYAPSIFLYAITLNATAVQKGAATDHLYTVTLDWSSTISGTDAQSQEFDVYRVVDGVTEDSPCFTGTDIYTWSEDVDQLATSHTLTYIVKGRPVEAVYNKVSSNEAAVVIPGYDEQERLSLTLLGSSESSYDIATQQNCYANNLLLNQGTEYSVLASHVVAGTVFSLHRKTTSPTATDVVCATLTVNSVSGSGTSTKINYTLNYLNQERADAAKYPMADGATGSFGVNSSLEINVNDFTFCDQFAASTANNTHPAQYQYELQFLSAATYKDAVTGEDTHLVHSNTAVARVYKTTTSLAYGQASKAAVDADTNGDSLLPLSNGVDMEVSALNDHNVINYYLVCNQNFEGTNGAYAQNNNDGTYTSFQPDGTTTKQTTPAVEILSSTESLSSGAASYEPIIEVYRNDGTGKRNTFGADRKSADIMKVSAVVAKAVQTPEAAFTVEGVTGILYKTTLTITPDIPDDLEAYRIRVWRYLNDGDAVEEAANASRLNHADAIYDATASGSEITLDGSEVIFGARQLADGEEMPVNFIVRLYGKHKSGGISTSSADKRRTLAAEEYQISETRIVCSLDNTIVTGIDDIETDGTAVRTDYYDLLGRRVKPSTHGIFIRVETLTDGTQRTTKINR